MNTAAAAHDFAEALAVGSALVCMLALGFAIMWFFFAGR